MDCEKCDPLLIDELYGELDDVTSAAVRRHVAGCARCSEAFEKLSGGKKLAAMMQEPVPDGLEMRIMEATKEAQKVVPIRGRGSRALSWAGSWAMRPQTAMAALFLLMIGSSAVFLGKGRDSSAPSMVEEHSAPVATIERDRSAMAEAPAAQAAASSAAALGAAKRSAPADEALAQASRPSAAPPPAAKAGSFDDQLGSGASRAKSNAPAYAGAEQKQSADSEGQLWSANSAYRSQNYSEATRLYDQSAKKGDLEAELGAARSVRDGTGCPSAVIRYDALASHAPGTSQANAATFEAAKCYESFGDYDAATARFKKLGGTSYAAQAKAEIDKMNTMVKSKGGSVTGGAAVAKPAAPRMEAAPKKVPSISGSMD